MRNDKECIAYKRTRMEAHDYPKTEASLIALKAIKESTYSGEVIFTFLSTDDIPLG